MSLFSLAKGGKIFMSFRKNEIRRFQHFSVGSRTDIWILIEISDIRIIFNLGFFPGGKSGSSEQDANREHCQSRCPFGAHSAAENGQSQCSRQVADFKANKLLIWSHEQNLLFLELERENPVYVSISMIEDHPLLLLSKI